jgi:tubulin polyglutamylase complex subunit 2
LCLNEIFEIFIEDTLGVQGIEIVKNMPSERMAITSWEQRHSCTLPKDLKNFYLATDGFKLIWNYEYAG